jgi:hypothetical protein
VDYVTSNLAESFNAKVKSLKGLMLWQIFDKIRQMIMIKIDDEGMTNGPPIFAYLVFGLGKVSLERLSRPIKAMV